MQRAALWRRLVAEGLGSAFLAAVVIGSGIAAQRLSPGNAGLELFENAAVTAAGLYAIILMFGPVSGAHLNPVVSVVDAAFGGLSWRDAAAYVPAQVGGCIGGALVANLMFAGAAVSISTKHRASGAHWLGEVVATLGLLLVIFSLARTGRGRATPPAVGVYIGAAYFFTSSTSFANPAIAVGRMFSNTFAGIAPASVPGFVVAQAVGGIVGFLLVRLLYPGITPQTAADVVLPQLGNAASPVSAGHGPRPADRPTGKPEVLFVCTHNAGRSQMAAAFLRRAGEGRVVVSSAGSEPGDELNPAVVEALAEVGLDISAERPKRLLDTTARRADVVVTMGCGDSCPVYPGKRYLDWDLPDPAGRPIEEVRLIRDEIELLVERLVAELLGT